MFRKRLWLALISLVALAMLGVKCDNPTDPDPPKKEEDVTVTFDPRFNGSTYEEAILYNNATGEKIGSGKQSVKKEEDTQMTVRVEGPDVKTKTHSVIFDKDKTEPIPLEKKEAETATLSYEIHDASADSLVPAHITYKGKTIGENQATGSITREVSDQAADLCATAEYFKEDNCKSVTLNQDRSVTIELTRKTVEISFTVNRKSDGGSVDNPEISVEDWYGQMYTYSSGERTHSFGARGGNRDISVTADGYNPFEQTISADSGHDLTVELERDEPTYACNDGVDNDGDGLIDEEDGGCVDSEGNYDPKDDNETIRVRTITSYGNEGDTLFVSGAEGHYELGFVPSSAPELPPEIIKASVEITLRFKALVSDTQDNEEVALKINTGPNDDNLNTTNITEIVEDVGKDGWKKVEIVITKDYFPNGTSYEIIIVHASKVRGNAPTDGNDDVILRTPERVTDFIIEIRYEPEDVGN